MNKRTILSAFGIGAVVSGMILCTLQAGQLNRSFDPMELFKGKSLNDTKIASGLKEALKIGINNTVKLLGKQDGYFLNELVKIAMPEKFQMADKALRAVGFSQQLDEFVLSMNRAAERAAPYARDIFIEAIFDMTFEDAAAILKGEETAATEYFKKATSEQLVKTFRPHVEKALGEYGVTKKYQGLVGQYQSIPLVKNLPVFSIEDYVINKAMDGLFLVLGNEERKIRTDPKARVTRLLKEVFSAPQE